MGQGGDGCGVEAHAEVRAGTFWLILEHQHALGHRKRSSHRLRMSDPQQDEVPSGDIVE